MQSFRRLFPPKTSIRSAAKEATRPARTARAPGFEPLEDRTTPVAFGTLTSTFVVNDGAAGNQRHSDIAMAGDGRAVAVWEQGGTVFARHLAPTGAVTGSDIIVHAASGGTGGKPRVAMDAGGRWAVAYEVETSGDKNIRYRAYSANGSSAYASGEAATFDLGKQQTLPDIDMARDGSFVIAWNHAVNFSQTNLDVRARRFDTLGTPLGNDFAVAGANTSERELAPRVATNSLDGRFAVTWIVETAGQFSPTVPKASIYNVSSGSPVAVMSGLSLPGVSAAGDRALLPHVAGDESGNFMFVWNRTRGDSGNNELRRRIINADLTLTNDVNATNNAELTELFSVGGVAGGANIHDAYAIVYLYEGRVRSCVQIDNTGWNHIALTSPTNPNGDPSVAMSGDRFIVSSTNPAAGPLDDDITARIYGLDPRNDSASPGFRGYVDASGQLWSGTTVHGQAIPLTSTLMANLSKAVTWTDFINIPGALTNFEDEGQSMAARVVETGEWWEFKVGSATPRGQWNPAAGWVDVRAMDLDNLNAVPYSLVGRTASGEWWASKRVSPGVFQNVFLGAWNPGAGWHDVLVGDFNGDYKDDLAGRTATGQWWVGISNGSTITTTLWGAWNEAADWRDVRVGKFDASGRDSIIGRTASGQWWLARSTETSFEMSLHTSWSGAVVWVDVNVGDFNGDGLADLAGRVQSSGQWYIAITPNGSGTVSTTYAGVWNPAVNWSQVVVGDFNRDGRSDIMGRDSASGIWWCNLSRPNMVLGSRNIEFSTVQWGVWSPNVSWSRVASGHFPH
jgi:hypothetical protein